MISRRYRPLSTSPCFGSLATLLVALTGALQIACTRAPSPQGSPSLELTSASFSGDTIQKANTCDGRDWYLRSTCPL